MRLLEILAKLQSDESIEFSTNGESVRFNLRKGVLEISVFVDISEIQLARFDVLEYQIDGAIQRIRNAADHPESS